MTSNPILGRRRLLAGLAAVALASGSGCVARRMWMTSITPDPTDSAYLSVVTYRASQTGGGKRRLQIEIRVKPDRASEIDALRLTGPDGSLIGERRVSAERDWYTWAGTFPEGTYVLEVLAGGKTVERYKLVFQVKSILDRPGPRSNSPGLGPSNASTDGAPSGP
ncbi:MAG: hypothetical protein ABEJ28_06145 [Salinigranum sp.]